ncbi:DNA polymerase subunit beta [Lamprobacter modestohalophilus]|uniref:DNA polymerase subunit beta n=1 Tax=Lamprobacter modestohalophilus TaxID=1064514 RepID=A0A9X0W7P4_9GAMM|nr:nucleotidyltransferase domain-containing protein [Lamprobacter modestohalophilus]MBK1618567.1 DNA polymerase subunit beta [Lamprobacter modestohalophilus]
MIDRQTIESAAHRLVGAARAPMKVILFGSYAVGRARDDSDLDLLVVERELPAPADEYNRLRGAIGAIGVGVDLLLYSQQEFERRQHWQTSPVYDAVREGQILYERPA